MFDIDIADADVWHSFSDCEIAIDGEASIAIRMEMRKERIKLFLEYLCKLEEEVIAVPNDIKILPCMS